MSENKISLKAKKLEFGVDEAIKSLRTNLLYSGNLHAIAVTSTTAGEGKSTIAFELARSFADLGKRTVLIDCDLRKSMIATGTVFQKDYLVLVNYSAVRRRKLFLRQILTTFIWFFQVKMYPIRKHMLTGERFNSFVDALRRAVIILFLIRHRWEVWPMP